MLSAYGKLRSLGLALMDVGSVLTSASDHPRVIERQGPTGPERGFLLKHHEKNPSDPLSPFFLNLRTPYSPTPGPLTPELVEHAAECMWSSLVMEDSDSAFDIDVVVGVPRAGDPFAKVIAGLAVAAWCSLAKEENGGTRSIAPHRSALAAVGQTALLVDDMITKADSKLEAIKVLRDAGLAVTDVVVLVDREQGGREELARHGCELHTVFTIADLLDLYVECGRIDPKLRLEITAYIADYAMR
ncbi:hypothetical protein HYV30_01560 [Candidatus Kaiserbacteria bacterium]|nr:hypothetical protein [Candidatus Kaiserbacteria bacterium]